MTDDTIAFELSPTQREMVMSVRRLAQDCFRDRWRQWQDGTFPWENMRDLAEIGVLSMSVPQAYGGLAMSVLDAALVLEDLAKVCYVTAMAVLGEMALVPHQRRVAAVSTQSPCAPATQSRRPLRLVERPCGPPQPSRRLRARLRCLARRAALAQNELRAASSKEQAATKQGRQGRARVT